MARLLIVENEQALVERAADWIAERLGGAPAGAPIRSIALSGGSTPRPVYERLARAPVEWSRLRVFFGDERAVPADHPDSNFRMARAALLDRVPIPAAAIHPMPAWEPDLEGAARRYADLLPDRLDLVLLGMGDDGHTASLFPGTEAARERSARVVAVVSGAPIAPRLTVTAPVIESAREVLMLVAGQSKAGRVAEVLEGPLVPTRLPAQYARDRVWIVDRAAASRLSKVAS